MKLKILTPNFDEACRIKNAIIENIHEGRHLTWEHDTGTVNNQHVDVIFHNREQYVNDPEKQVIFTIKVLGNNVVINATKWSSNPAEISHEIKALHLGRLVEVLLTGRYAHNIEITD